MAGFDSDSGEECQELLSPFKNKRPRSDAASPQITLSQKSLADSEGEDFLNYVPSYSAVKEQENPKRRKGLFNLDDILSEKTKDDEKKKKKQEKLERQKKSDKMYTTEDEQHQEDLAAQEAELENDCDEANKKQFQEAADDLKIQHIDEDLTPAETERVLGPKTPPPFSRQQLLVCADKYDELCQLGTTLFIKLFGQPPSDMAENGDPGCNRSGMVEAVAREMLLGGWLKLYLLEQQKCPESIARWLFQMVAHCEDVALAQAACTLLAQVQPNQMWVNGPKVNLRQGGSGVQPPPPPLFGPAVSKFEGSTPTWAPTCADFVKAFETFGYIAEASPAEQADDAPSDATDQDNTVKLLPANAGLLL
eukprot:CAMPEP_0198215092 /NCGR_PEP_ID=MMETSP1445-20131203/46959_1 /TAXON_ID=36898 /ORGANISM="Pyramimonas sp., Strain CCMP2087" /LENGTH=363 /DNA_ID=CAMNT_0043890637 /DNA_START=152 /DNA_END=1239 /DNA_ORIENTATION=-